MSMPVVIPENPGPIIGAGNKNILEAATSTPSMRSALIGWNRPILIELITTKINDLGIAEKVSRPISTTGTLQPMRPREVALKPEGFRAWRWFCLHTTNEIGLKPEDRVVRKGIPYRVMSSMGYEDYGFFKYELVQDYQEVK